jgi:glutamine amidotransferase
MCRVLSYIGEPIIMEDLIYKPSNSLVVQSYNPKFMFHYKNFSGSGFIAWDQSMRDKKHPFLYKSKNLPFYDRNLLNLTKHVEADCAIAHVRGGALTKNAIVIDSNTHPFLFPGAPIALAHNGTLKKLNDIKPELADFIDKKWLSKMRGTTDTEWIYATLLTHLCQGRKTKFSTDAVVDALQKTYDHIQKLRLKKGIDAPSPVNLFISNGDMIIIARFVYDFGNYSKSLREAHLRYHTLWYTYGEQFAVDKEGIYQMMPGDPRSIICSSEPLSVDTTRWLEVPEYSIMSIERKKSRKLKLKINDVGL